MIDTPPAGADADAQTEATSLFPPAVPAGDVPLTERQRDIYAPREGVSEFGGNRFLRALLDGGVIEWPTYHVAVTELALSFFLGIDRWPVIEEIEAAFEHVVGVLGSPNDEDLCTPTCAPHLFMFCSPECEDAYRARND